MKKSQHFAKRQSQRSISDLAVQLIVQFGDIEEQKGGSCRVQLSANEARRLEKQLMQQWEKIPNIVVVEQAETLITVYHRH